MDQQYVQKLILELLSDRTPEFGARLKQRLNRVLANAGQPAFSEEQFGHRKFSEFLISALGDYLLIEKPSDDGDIKISLKASGTSYARPLIVTAFPSIAAHSLNRAVAASADQAPLRLVRGDVWQAFTHLNPLRKRFMERDTWRVLHFLETDSELAVQVDENPERFVSIPPIEGETQSSWMHEFLSLGGFSDTDVSSLSRMLAEPYSSKLNSLFSRVLGKHQAEWKRFRAQRVTDIINAWAQAHDVPSEHLFTRRLGSPEVVPQPAVAVAPGQLTPREQAQKLLDMMTEQEVVTVAIPALLGCVLANPRF